MWSGLVDSAAVISGYGNPAASPGADVQPYYCPESEVRHSVLQPLNELQIQSGH